MTMIIITIRDIPKWLHKAIKQEAEINRRSMNQEIIKVLETHFTIVENSDIEESGTTSNSGIQDT